MTTVWLFVEVEKGKTSFFLEFELLILPLCWLYISDASKLTFTLRYWLQKKKEGKKERKRKRERKKNNRLRYCVTASLAARDSVANNVMNAHLSSTTPSSSVSFICGAYRKSFFFVSLKELQFLTPAE